MALTTRVWSVGKLLLLAGALLATFSLFFVISMRLALQSRDVVVPKLAGITVQQASLVLSDMGLTLKVEEGRRVDPKVAAGRVVIQDPPARIAEIRTSDQPAGVIVGQWPAAKAKGTEVALLVNRGERGATYVMPDVIGVEGDKAAELLRRFGFRVAVTGTYPYPGIPAGIVLRQNPRSGFQVAPGEAISLEVSR
jgi:beta-lactam-binding protein with PASTA domain